MNYRHIFHAGNFADVFKHVLLVLLIGSLKKKDTPFAYLDTHAGAGLYDLAGAEARQTGEYQGGVVRVAAASRPPPEIEAYLAIVRSCQQANQNGIRFYPGSPLIAASCMRTQDRLALCELHPEAHAALRQLFAGEPRAGVHHLDGFAALKALLPPKERRGLVLVDPPYEQEREIAAILAGLRQALLRWPTGIYAIWYPITARAQHERFLKRLAASGIRRIFHAELDMGEAATGNLRGCGMAVIRPPFQLDARLRSLLPGLAKMLGRGTARARSGWLVRE